MKNKIALLALLVPAIGFADFNDRKGLKLGVMLPYHPASFGAQVEIDSPRLFRLEMDGGKRRASFRLALDAGAFEIPNLVSVGGQLVPVTNGQFGLSVRIQQEPPDSIVQPYALIGASLASWSGFLSTKSTSVAFRAAIGCDFVFLKAVDEWLVGETDSSFFVQLDIIDGHPGADRLPGAPNLLNGITPSIGVRSSF